MAAIDMRHAMYMPTEEELTRLLSVVCGDGGLWKLGSCYEDQLGSRPFDAVHYDETWFVRSPVCVAQGIDSKALAALLETAGIRHLKRMGVGVNVKNSDDVPHDGISAARRQALYVVPVKPTITTVRQFRDEHKSYYKQTHGGAGLKAQRVAMGLPPPPQAAGTAGPHHAQGAGPHHAQGAGPHHAQAAGARQDVPAPRWRRAAQEADPP